MTLQLEDTVLGLDVHGGGLLPMLPQLCAADERVPRRAALAVVAAVVS